MAGGQRKGRMKLKKGVLTEAKQLQRAMAEERARRASAPQELTNRELPEAATVEARSISAGTSQRGTELEKENGLADGPVMGPTGTALKAGSQAAGSIAAGSLAAGSNASQPSEPPSKMPRTSGFRRCTTATPANLQEIPVYSMIMDMAQWRQLPPQEVKLEVLTEACTFLKQKIMLMPRPLHEAMKSRVQRFYLKTEMSIEAYREPFVPQRPEVAYALPALTHATEQVDKEIENLERLNAVLSNPDDMEKLFTELGLSLQPSAPKEDITSAHAPKIQHQGNDFEAKFSAAVAESFDLLKVQAEQLDGFVLKSETLLGNVATVTATPKNPTHGHAPVTPHAVMAALQASGPSTPFP